MTVLYFSTFLLWRHFLMTTFDYEDIIFEIYSGGLLIKWYFTYMQFTLSISLNINPSGRLSCVCVCVCVCLPPAVFLKVVSNVRTRMTCMCDCN